MNRSQICREIVRYLVEHRVCDILPALRFLYNSAGYAMLPPSCDINADGLVALCDKFVLEYKSGIIPRQP